jgi:hypothetical protein
VAFSPQANYTNWATHCTHTCEVLY